MQLPTSLSDLTSRALSHDVLYACLMGRHPSDVSFLLPEHFPIYTDRLCWQTMLKLEEAGIPVEATPLIERLKRVPALEPVDWEHYILQIASEPSYSSGLGLEANAETMYDNYRRWTSAQQHLQGINDALDLTKPAPPDPSRPPRLNALSVDDILKSVVPEPRGPWKGVIPPGLTMLGARPKSGKSVLMLQLATALGCGGMHFGQKMEPMKVCYYALEDKVGRLQTRLQKLDAPPGTNVDFVLSIRPLQDGGTDEIVAQSAHYDLIVIDTIERATPGKDFVKESAVYAEILGRIQSAALEHNMAVVGVVHRRKQQVQLRGDPVDDVFGSTQLTTAADCVLCIYPEEAKGKRRKRAQLLGRARDLEDIDLTMEFDPATLCWQRVEAEEEEEEVREQTEAETEILDALKRLGKARAATVAKFAHRDRGNTSARMQQLWKKGRIRMELIDNVPYYYLEPELEAPKEER